MDRLMRDTVLHYDEKNIFRNEAAMSTGHSPGGLAMIRRSTSRYSSSITAWDWFFVLILNLLKIKWK